MDPESGIPLTTNTTNHSYKDHQLFSSNRSNTPTWYYWEPVHHAAYHVDEPKLRAIVDTLREENRLDALNVLTLFSENPLHVLLSYGRQTISFDVQLSNGWMSRICHVIAKEKPEVVKCARVLIDAGVNINHNNIWNETPLLIAIRYRQLEVVKLLLQRPEIDLDTCKSPGTDQSARDLLKENEIHLDLLNQTTTLFVDPVQTLFTYLKSGNEETFLRYNNENIQQYVDATDGGFTMLELCLIKGYLSYHQKNASTTQHSEKDFDLMNSPMLDFFCSQGFGRSVEHLLNNGATILKKNAILGLNVYQLSVKLGYYPFLAVLLEHHSNQITKTHLIDQLKQVDESYFKNENYNAKHVVHLLVSKLETFERENVEEDQRNVLNKIMDLYLDHSQSSDQYNEKVCQLLNMGATLTDNLNNTPRLQRVSYESLKMHLDNCLDGDLVFCDSFVIDDEKAYSETETLHILCHDFKKKELLNHPLLIYFVHCKWLRTNKYFYINLVLYAFFLLSLYCYVLSLQIHRPSAAFKGFFITFLMVQAFKEMIQLLLYWRRYFYDLSNYLEIVAIGCSMVNIFGQNQHTMVVAILLSSCVFLMTLGQLPKFTKYMIIFNSTKYFLEYAAFYFIQFVSFALCFFILLPPQDQSEGLVDALGTISLRLFETLIYFIGQYDGDVNSVPEFPVFGRIIVAVFIFCMTIILNNLLVGLIVTDMDVIQKNGKLQRQVEMIRFINRIGAFLTSMEKILKRGGSWLKNVYSTTLFTAGEPKTLESDFFELCLDVFDDDDLAWIRRLRENKTQTKNILCSLYEYIISEIYSEHKNLKEAQIRRRPR